MTADASPVAQTSKSAVPQVSKPADRANAGDRKTRKKSSTTNHTRLCAGCLATAVKTMSARVIFFQENHKCDECTRRPIDVFVADLYCPLEQRLKASNQFNLSSHMMTLILIFGYFFGAYSGLTCLILIAALWMTGSMKIDIEKSVTRTRKFDDGQ